MGAGKALAEKSWPYNEDACPSPLFPPPAAGLLCIRGRFTPHSHARHMRCGGRRPTFDVNCNEWNGMVLGVKKAATLV